jgi:hypothetical protein
MSMCYLYHITVIIVIKMNAVIVLAVLRIHDLFLCYRYNNFHYQHFLLFLSLSLAILIIFITILFSIVTDIVIRHYHLYN